MSETRKLSPRTATTLDQICKLPRDNLNAKNGWILLDGTHVVLCNQLHGESATGSVRFTRREFNRFIDWYNGVTSKGGVR